MNPKAKPVILVIALTILVVSVLRGQSKKTTADNSNTSTMPNITMMLNFDTMAR